MQIFYLYAPKTKPMPRIFSFSFIVLISLSSFSQNVSVGSADQVVKLDGKMDESAWGSAGIISSFKMVEPNENDEPSYTTMDRVIADCAGQSFLSPDPYAC